MRKILIILMSLLSSIVLSAFAEEPAENAFTLNTTAFLNEGAIPVLYTCDGKNVSPQFDWVNPPAKTQAFALILSDPEAPNGIFYHWILYNLPSTVKALDEGIQKLPSGTFLGKNSFGKLAYNGPCPPKGTAHTYHFTLYALDKKLTLPAGAEGKMVLDAMQKNILGKVEIKTTYSRWLK